MGDTKFRAKVKNTRYPHRAEWLYGGISRNRQGQCFIDTVDERYMEVEEISIGQYIGQTDKKGKEIYIKDVVTVRFGNNPYVSRGNGYDDVVDAESHEVTGVVVWDADMCGIAIQEEETKHMLGVLKSYEWCELEVIGTVGVLLEREINGWWCYRNDQGKMIACHRVAGEQVTFEKEIDFENWLEAEKKVV
ncbi:YopX family protein [Bacillus thuringiensis]|uniref:YopX family protein n=1 Tax=Bacillus thuringiensis TaxID=1428 RepID=UPI00210042CA|nr:YopX family protein [Bacillus thuringiensis]